MMRLLLTAMALLIGLAGCGNAEDSTTAPSGDPDTLVSYSRTGGIAGVDERLRVAPDGAATLTLGPTANPASFQLAAADLATLRDEVDAADLANFEPPGPTACADCFVYDIETADGRASYAETDQPPPAVQALAAHLGAIVEHNYPAGAPAVKGG